MKSSSRTQALPTYPRTYRASGFWKIVMLVCSVVAIVGPTVAAWFTITEPAATRSTIAFAISLSLLFIAMGIYCLLWVVKARLVLLTDSITVYGPIKTKALFLSKLRGWRFLPTSPLTLVLESEEKRTRSTKVNLLFPLDEEFYEWLSTFPALDIDDTEASTTEILKDERLGNTVHERAGVLEAGMKRARIITIIASIASLWTWIFPQPYVPLMLVLVALPLVATEMLRRSNGLFRVDEERNDRHPNIAIAFMIPAVTLAFRAVIDFEVLRSTQAFAWPIAIGALLTVVLVKFDPSLIRRKAIIPVIAMLCMAYGYGATIEINALHTRTPDASYSAAVQGKHITNGKHTSYNLELGPWGSKTGSEDMDVGRTTYEQVQPGDTAILTIRTGLLGIKWYHLSSWHH
jgi:hypothetical protein